MKNFKTIRLETNSSSQDGNKSENSLLNLKRDGTKIVKNLFFRTMLIIIFNNWELKYPQIPKMSLFKRAVRVCFTDTPYWNSGIEFRN